MSSLPASVKGRSGYHSPQESRAPPRAKEISAMDIAFLLVKERIFAHPLSARSALSELNLELATDQTFKSSAAFSSEN